MPLRIKPERGQRPEYLIQSPSKQRCHVLQHNVSGLHFANDSHRFVEESAAFSSKSCSLSCVGNVLAGEPSANDINPPVSCGLGGEGANVIVSPYVGPVFLQNAGSVIVDFDLPFADHPGPLKAKIEAADSGEE